MVRLLISLGLDNIARNLWIQTVPRSSPKLPEKPEEKQNPEPVKSAKLECKRCFKHFPSEDLLKFFMHEKKCSSMKYKPAPVHQIPPGITPLKDIEKVNARKTPKVKNCYRHNCFIVCFLYRLPKLVQFATDRLLDQAQDGSILCMLICPGNTSQNN